MLKLARFIEGLFLPTVAIACLIISLADLFDIFHFIGDRLPMLTLLLVSLAITSVSSVQGKCIEMCHTIQQLVSEVELEELGSVVEHIDPNLRKVLEDDYFLDIVNFIQMAARERNVHVNDWARFCHYYVRTLQLFPKTTFLSVSTSITSNLWKEAVIADAMARFIKGRGKIKQVFILGDAKELALPEVKAVLTHLQTIGVQVSIVFHASTPNELKKNFIVESQGKVGWEMQLDREGSVTTSIVTTNQEKTASYRKTFEKLRISDIRKFSTI